MGNLTRRKVLRAALLIAPGMQAPGGGGAGGDGIAPEVPGLVQVGPRARFGASKHGTLKISRLRRSQR